MKVYLVVFKCLFHDGGWWVPENSNSVWRVGKNCLNKWRKFLPVGLLTVKQSAANIQLTGIETSQ